MRSLIHQKVCITYIYLLNVLLNFHHFSGLECLCGLHVVDNDGSSVRNGVITAAVGNTSTSDCPANATKVITWQID